MDESELLVGGMNSSKPLPKRQFTPRERSSCKNSGWGKVVSVGIGVGVAGEDSVGLAVSTGSDGRERVGRNVIVGRAIESSVATGSAVWPWSLLSQAARTKQITKIIIAIGISDLDMLVSQPQHRILYINFLKIHYLPQSKLWQDYGVDFPSIDILNLPSLKPT